ncbi:MAG: hypothetical protein J6E46_12215 [Faecalicoccus sp.]|nr:hypothetical protein [Faecalicoccus sp.]
MKKLGKILGILVRLVALVLVGVYAFKAYEDYKRNQEKKAKEEDKIKALSKINYTIPDGFGLPVEGDRGYGSIDYNYKENDMVAQIVLEVWNQEKYPAYNDVDQEISRIIEGREEKVISGPEDVDLNGLKAQTVVVGSSNVSEEWNVHLASRKDYYVFEKDGYLYILHYNVIDEKKGDRDDAETNKCVTSREIFVNSIGDK